MTVGPEMHLRCRGAGAGVRVDVLLRAGERHHGKLEGALSPRAQPARLGSVERLRVRCPPSRRAGLYKLSQELFKLARERVAALRRLRFAINNAAASTLGGELTTLFIDRGQPPRLPLPLPSPPDLQRAAAGRRRTDGLRDSDEGRGAAGAGARGAAGAHWQGGAGPGAGRRALPHGRLGPGAPALRGPGAERQLNSPARR